MHAPINFPQFRASLTDADLDEIESHLARSIEIYRHGNPGFEDRIAGLNDALLLIINHRRNATKTRRPFCIISPLLFLN